jgi:crotonobetainyl-CoA:carnitine CoA-transferase CaiB-like acyl-CoA transferase
MSDILTTYMPTHASKFLRDGAGFGRGAGWPHWLTVLKCKDGKYLCTQNAETYFWERFCKAIGREDLPRVAAGTTGEDYQYVVREVKATMLTRTRDEWLEVLRAADTCVSPILELGEAIDDPHNRHRETFWELDHPTFGKVRQVGFPVRFSETPGRFRSFSPQLGQHTVELLESVGYSSSEIDAMLTAGAVKASAD